MPNKAVERMGDSARFFSSFYVAFLAPATHRGRVCRAWHRTSEVQVLVPAVRGAEGTELWQIKDNIAREHGYDLEVLVAHLHTKKRPAGQRVVDLCAMRGAAEQGAPVDADKPLFGSHYV